MATVTGLEDRGTYWNVLFDDGGFDAVPKDPNAIDVAAANAQAIGQTALATKLRGYAAHIRKDGKPVDVPMSLGSGALLVGGLTLGAFLLFSRVLK